MHPRIEALRASGDQPPLRTILTRQFPVVVAIELLLGITVLFVAPFLHRSARYQAFQADAAKHGTAVPDLPKLPEKAVSASNWVWGTTQTIAVVAVMLGGYQMSGRLARRARTLPVTATEASL